MKRKQITYQQVNRKTMHMGGKEVTKKQAQMTVTLTYTLLLAVIYSIKTYFKSKK